MSFCPIIGDVNFDHLIKVVFSSFLHCQVTIFFFNKFIYLFIYLFLR